MAVSWELLLGGVSSMVDSSFRKPWAVYERRKTHCSSSLFELLGFFKTPQDYFLDKMYILKLTINRYDSWSSVANAPFRLTSS